MKQPKKTPKITKDPVQRSIESRERAIGRLEQKKAQLRGNADKVKQEAEAECKKIDQQIAEKKLLLTALRNGQLKA